MSIFYHRFIYANRSDERAKAAGCFYTHSISTHISLHACPRCKGACHDIYSLAVYVHTPANTHTCAHTRATPSVIVPIETAIKLAASASSQEAVYLASRIRRDPEHTDVHGVGRRIVFCCYLQHMYTIADTRLTSRPRHSLISSSSTCEAKVRCG